jgi:predicted aspartyl protease
MKNKLSPKMVIAAAVFYFTFVGFCQSIQAQTQTRIRLVHDTVAIVSLTANGQGPFDFILDTGTNSTIVDPSIARRLSLALRDRIQLSTLGGTQTVTRSSLRTLAAGTAEVEDVEVLVQDLSELRRVDSNVQGIVGQNFLSHFNYVLDYRNRSLQFELGGEIRGTLADDPVRVEVSEDKMLVASEVQSRGEARLWLLLDSGANMITLLRKPALALDGPTRQDWLELSASGQAGWKVDRMRALQVGTEKFHDVNVALPDTQPSDAERIEDGVLPTALFNAVYVNNREGFVVFNPRMKKN